MVFKAVASTSLWHAERSRRAPTLPRLLEGSGEAVGGQRGGKRLESLKR